MGADSTDAGQILALAEPHSHLELLVLATNDLHFSVNVFESASKLAPGAFDLDDTGADLHVHCNMKVEKYIVLVEQEKVMFICL